MGVFVDECETALRKESLAERRRLLHKWGGRVTQAMRGRQ